MAKKTKNPEDIVETNNAEAAAPVATQPRVFNQQIKFHSDLFELKPTKMQVRVPLTNPPEYKPVAHMHWFRTFDSDGRKQTRSHSVGGHFHVLEVIPQKDGAPIVKCGPAVREIQNKYGKRIIVPFIAENREPGAEDAGDSHVHQVVYNRSQELSMRTANAEAAKVLTKEASKESSIPGIQG